MLSNLFCFYCLDIIFAQFHVNVQDLKLKKTSNEIKLETIAKQQSDFSPSLRMRHEKNRYFHSEFLYFWVIVNLVFAINTNCDLKILICFSIKHMVLLWNTKSTFAYIELQTAVISMKFVCVYAFDWNSTFFTFFMRQFFRKFCIQSKFEYFTQMTISKEYKGKKF